MRPAGLNPPAHSPSVTRLKLVVRGAVQGVGFRPFVFRLATECGLKGWVNNSNEGVFIEVEGPPAQAEQFLLRLTTEKPPRSFIQSLEPAWLDPAGYTQFEIRPSETGRAKTALVLPDIATCADCRREIFDPQNRRFFYPFTNCTNCGPRFSIIEALPYDRANTSMRGFTMCPQCQAEYDNPLDRRFHAQPNACPVCGPRLELWDPAGNAVIPAGEGGSRAALEAAARALVAGHSVAVKGLGGFHLMVAAHDEGAVRHLREVKHREEKPFALMFPSLDSVKAVCDVTPLEERLLLAPESPIVLLRKLASPAGPRVPASAVAPNNPYLGVMLPYTPLHHLLLSLAGFPVVATSGNLRDEPICTDEKEALERLRGMVELFLVHNRPIVRHVDDSIVRVMAGREMVLRHARGYAPLPVSLVPWGRVQGLANPQAPQDKPNDSPTVLAVGAHLKNSVALAIGSQVFISQHIGDLETEQAYAAFHKVIADFQTLYATKPTVIAADGHPDYLSTKFASSHAGVPGSGKKLVLVQHHLAHVLACMGENELAPPVLGVSWDGTGYGADGHVWGGEFFLVTECNCQRVAHLREFPLPGGDQAVKEPRRTALGVLFEAFGEAAFAQDLASLSAFTVAELATLKTMLARRLNSPRTSSAGRLFDAVSSLAGLRQRARFEGQAAMELEFALDQIETGEAYPISITEVRPPPAPSSSPKNHLGLRTPETLLVLDWEPLLQALLADIKKKVPAGLLSARFHNALVEAIVGVARKIGQERVVLSGGCFQNRYLAEGAVCRLNEAGFRPYWHQRVPPNDGGICLGQVVAALRLTV